jgi:single-strand DNA-binding protein
MNKVILQGRLSAEPTLKYTQTNNKPVCTFTLAVDRPHTWGENKKTDFIKCIAWNKLAEFTNKFNKGRQVTVVGAWTTRTWDDNESRRHYENECQLEEAYFADSRREQGDAYDGQEGHNPDDDQSSDSDLPF